MLAKHKEIGRRIKEARRQKGMTQEQLAEAVGVGVTHISHIETSQCLPGLALVLEIMDILEKTPNEIFCGSSEPARPFLLKETEELFEGFSVEDSAMLLRQFESIAEMIREDRDKRG